MILTEVFVALGGNIGDSGFVLQEALKQVAEVPDIYDLKVSRFYLTTPVSDIPQNHFINAVCCFKTTLNAKSLLIKLQEIETKLGKQPKLKNAPRIIDLDILFFGTETHAQPELEIPHPRWRERLFVLVPLFDLAQVIPIPVDGEIINIDIQQLLLTFKNKNQESVCLFQEEVAI